MTLAELWIGTGTVHRTQSRVVRIPVTVDCLGPLPNTNPWQAGPPSAGV